MQEGALRNLKVLEYGEFVSGPYCAKLLADLGAEVIKIEKPKTGDVARSRCPFLNNVPNPERSGLFLYLNTNKLGITLNMRTSTGKRIFKELVKETDILIESNPPKKMKENGFDYESLKGINPSLIMTSITPFGQDGPYRDHKASNLNIAFGSKLIYKQSNNNGNNTISKPGRFFGDHACGLTAAMATLGAVYAHQSKGEGQHIDISKQEALIALQRVTAVSYPNHGVADASLLRSKLSIAMGGLMRCEDGYVIVTLAEKHQWRSFVKLMSEPEWAKDPKLEDVIFRADNYNKIEPLINEWMMEHTKQEIYHQGQAVGCPVAMVNSIDQIANCEQMKARNFFVEIKHKENGKLKYPQAPYRFSKTPWMVRRPAPLLGEYNEEILCNRLGYSKDDLVKFAESRII